MDYHFVVPKTTHKRRRIPLSYLVIPALILSAILPFLLTYVFSPSSLNITSQADNRPELRVWFTPSRIAARNGQEVTLTVKANFDGGDLLLPSLRLQLDGTGVSLSKNILFYPKPFRGEVTLGSITVTPIQGGNVVVTIPKDSLKIDPPIGDIDISVSSANFVVK